MEGTPTFALWTAVWLILFFKFLFGFLQSASLEDLVATGSLVYVCNLAIKVCVHIAYPPPPLLGRVSGSSMLLTYCVVEGVLELLIILPLPPDFCDYGLDPPPLTTLQILLPLPSLARIIKITSHSTYLIF